MKKHILTTLLALICGFAAFSAQAQVKVSGTVTDKDGLAVIGAGVIEQGTLNGTTTGADGKYTISVASDKSWKFPASDMKPSAFPSRAAPRLTW